MNFLWTTFTRFEPARDIHAAATDVRGHHVSYTPPILIDARLKPWFPEELFCREDVAATVTAAGGSTSRQASRWATRIGAPRSADLVVIEPRNRLQATGCSLQARLASGR